MEATEFLRFQGVVHAVARATTETVPTERMYSMSLGSRQGNAHLHWHVAPLPPGVPYDECLGPLVEAAHDGHVGRGCPPCTASERSMR